MTDFSAWLAGEIVDWMSQGVDLPTAPTTVYVTVFDDTGTELDTDLQNGRVGVATGSGFTVTGTNFENAAEIDFGEATADLTNVQDVALYDGDAGTGANELARYTLDTAPFDVATGSRLFFQAGDLSFDVVDRTE